LIVVRLYNFLFGYLVLGATGVFTERFINLCTSRRIAVFGIKNTAENMLIMRVGLGQAEELREIASSSGVKLEVLGEKGLPMILKKLTGRKSFLIGFVLFAALVWYLATHIWMIEIPQTNLVNREKIRQDLISEGIKLGGLTIGIDQTGLQRKLMAKNQNLSWIWVDVQGTKVVVDLREKVPKPEVIPLTQPCNIVAKTDGVITALIVKEGTVQVEIGDEVTEGQVLVDSYISYGAKGERFSHAMANVYAHTKREISEVYPLHEQVRAATGKTKTIAALTILGKSFSFQKNRFEHYQSTAMESQMHIGNFYLPFSIITTTFEEVELQEQTYDPQKLIGDAKNYLTYVLKNEHINDKIIDTEFMEEYLDEYNVKITLIATLEQDIAMQHINQKEEVAQPLQ